MALRLIAVIALLLVLALPFTIAAKDKEVPDKFSASFSALMTLDAKSDLDFELKGRVIHDFPHTRIEFEHPVTREQIVLLLNAEYKKAVLLYTDTLNGIEFDYANKYYADWPAGFPGFLSGSVEVKPDGWTKKVGKPADDGTRLVELSKDDIKVQCTLDPNGHPLKMHVYARGRSTQFTFSDYTNEVEADPGLFEVPDDYAIEQVKQLKDDEALPL